MSSLDDFSHDDYDGFIASAARFGAHLFVTIARILHRLAWGDSQENDSISLPRAAKQLGIAESTLRMAIQRGDLPATRRGKKLLFLKKEDLRRYQERKVQ